MRKLFDPRRENAIQQRLLAARERPLRASLTRSINATYQEAANLVEQLGLLAADVAVTAHTTDIRKALLSHGETTAKLFAQRLKGQMKSAYPIHVQKQDALTDALLAQALAERLNFAPTFDQALTAFLQLETAARVTQVNDTTKDYIRGVIQSGLEGGKSMLEISKDLQARALPMSGYRAAMIARTETHTTANAGIQMQAETSEFETKKQWLSVRDSRTRSDHSAEDKTIVDQDKPFNVGGERLMFPGDPRGSAAQIIHCRCCVGHIIV